MGQQIFYVITPANIDVPLSIVHFKEKDCIVIPLLAEDQDFENLLYHSADSKSIKDFYEEAIIQSTYEYPTRKVFDFLREVQLNSFGIIGCSNWWTVPENTKPLLFIDNNRIEIPWDDFEESIHKKLGIQFTFTELIRNQKKYRDFYTAEEYYFTQFK